MHLLKLSFQEFIKEMQSDYLPLGWVDTVRIEMLSLTLAGCPTGSTFWDYYNKMLSLNAFLVDTPSFQDEDTFHQKVEVGLDAELTEKCCDKNCQNVKTLGAWA